MRTIVGIPCVLEAGTLKDEYLCHCCACLAEMASLLPMARQMRCAFLQTVQKIWPSTEKTDITCICP